MGSCLGDRAFNTFQLSGVKPTPKLPNRPVRRDENVCKNSMDLFCLRLVEGSTGFVDRVKLTQVSTRDLILLGSFLFAIVSGQCLDLR